MLRPDAEEIKEGQGHPVAAVFRRRRRRQGRERDRRCRGGTRDRVAACGANKRARCHVSDEAITDRTQDAATTSRKSYYLLCLWWEQGTGAPADPSERSVVQVDADSVLPPL
jgi:hypothetical protein